MKLNDPRKTLIAGLALALGVCVSSSAFGAGGVSGKSMRLTQAPMNLTPVPMPYGPAPGPGGLTPVPAAPMLNGTAPLQLNPNVMPQPGAPNGPSVINAPANFGSQPALVPVDRPPMGLLYGEQEMLDGKKAEMKRLQGSPQGSYPAPPSAPPVNYGVPNGIMHAPNDVYGDGFGSMHSAAPLESIPHYSVGDRMGDAPPPGTLGQTYKRRSRLLEEMKHPRVGAVEVHLPENVDVTSRGLKSKWNGKVWRLESDPLLPGIPHIYEIKASWGEGTEPQVRTIRLIMGRIVDLDF